ncbi:MAG: AI-2E family transporter [Actinomycetota bacterium]|nr:AI-2E family transporter [Actinomycetota bacterium]
MKTPRQADYPGLALRTAAAYSWRILVVGALGYFVLRLLSHLMTAVVPFAVALLVTALLRPVLVFLRHRGVPRLLATVLAVLSAVIVLGGLVTVVILGATHQAPQLGNEINRLIPHVKSWLETGPLHVDATTVNNFSRTLTDTVSTHSSEVASTAVSTGKTIVDVVTGFVLAIFVTIFLLYDGEGIWEFCTRAAPTTVRSRVDAAGRAAWSTLSHYVRGTLIVAVYHGVVVGIVLAALGVPLVLPLAVLVALGSFIPLIGAVVFGLLAIGVAGLSHGVVAVIIVTAVLILDNQVEAHVLQPFVVGRYVRIHPLGVVLGLTVGALLLGVFGAIIVVPLIACINATVRSLLGSRTPELAMDPHGRDDDTDRAPASEEREIGGDNSADAVTDETR